MSDFFLGVTASLTASLIFLFIILFFLAPSIKISPFITKRVGKEEKGESPTFYVFKFVNTSYFSLFDVHIELWQWETIPLGNNCSDIKFKRLDMKLESLKYVPGYWYFGESKRNARYAVLPKTEALLDDHIKEDHIYLQLQITAKHGFTGLCRVFKKDFAIADSCISNKRHRHGKCLELSK